MRTLIDKRGVKVLLPSDDDLRPVVQLWNEKNGNFGEFFSFVWKHFYLVSLCDVYQVRLGVQFYITLVQSCTGCFF